MTTSRPTWIQSKFKVSLGYMRSHFERKQNHSLRLNKEKNVPSHEMHGDAGMHYSKKCLLSRLLEFPR